MTHDAQLILAVDMVLAAGVAAAGLVARLRLPALVLYAGLGMLVGSDGRVWVAFDDYRLARLVETIALVLILFRGRPGGRVAPLRPVLAPAVLLAVIGTVMTAVIVGLAASALFDFSLLEGLLLGASLAATDGTGVFALLRGVRLPLRLRRTLEGASGLNDPVGVLLVLVAIDLITKPHHDAWSTVAFLTRELAVGAAVGAAGGVLVARGARRAHRLSNGLLLVGPLATAALAYGVGCARRLRISRRLSGRTRAGRRAALRSRPRDRVSPGPGDGRRDRDVLRARAARVPKSIRPDQAAWTR